MSHDRQGKPAGPVITWPTNPDGSVNIARCPEHGLHGARDECFECGKPVEQIPMVPVWRAEKAEAEVEKLRGASREVVRVATDPILHEQTIPLRRTGAWNRLVKELANGR